MRVFVRDVDSLTIDVRLAVLEAEHGVFRGTIRELVLDDHLAHLLDELPPPGRAAPVRGESKSAGVRVDHRAALEEERPIAADVGVPTERVAAVAAGAAAAVAAHVRNPLAAQVRPPLAEQGR